MVSIQVELDDEVSAALQQLALVECRGAGEIVREAVAAFVQVRRPAPLGVGRYHSGRTDVSEQARSILRDATADGRWP